MNVLLFIICWALRLSYRNVLFFVCFVFRMLGFGEVWISYLGFSIFVFLKRWGGVGILGIVDSSLPQMWCPDWQS